MKGNGFQVGHEVEGVASADAADTAAGAGAAAEGDVQFPVVGEVVDDGNAAGQVLGPGGAFVAKVLQGGTEPVLLNRLKQAFARLRHVKPPASRADSAEMYLVATGFRNRPKAGDGPGGGTQV